MDVTSTGSATSASTTAKGQGSAVLTSDFQTFLKMLTVQMQNQDPLNPIDSTDYAVQLATFSGVEQQVQTNQLLGAMATQFGLMGMSQLAGWVGQEARAAADVWYSGTPVTLSPNPVAKADEAVLVVKDAKGNLVTRESLPVSTDLYQWFGADAAGDPLPEGRYSLSLESWRDGELLQTDPVEYYGRVIEARGGSGGTRLVFEGGIEVAATDITALRVPPG
ncbi:flagellar hook capping FlgD N-terminal domain-containing protein [Fuscovulum blasticum]|uniref:flagellar hook capping FlgD N-terminal domain-containing protein n=1 Tax=Fuscovulum blasticum TaxID=1075 RepID=UPI000D3E5DCD|nr:flagellar hook capping FlgD N-terminal domain-containing protein [Fuscovulum blasticum]AWD21964.1 flagellar basal body rod modification protein [Fuscovulum blasticum]